jgi:hypothetical protein
MRIPLYLIVVIAIAAVSCTTTHMTVDVYKPPEVRIPENAKDIGILSRAGSIPNQAIDSIVENVFSGTGNYTTYLGAQQAVLGAIDNIDYSEEFEQFEQINLTFNEELPDSFADPLDWSVIEEVTQRAETDLLLVVEYFSHNNVTDFTTYMQKKRESKAQVWTNTKLYSLDFSEKFIAQLKVYATAGWRLYYPQEKIILDTYITNDSLLWESDGRFLEEAEARLPNKSRAVEEAGFFLGENYTMRIISGWETVRRKFYAPRMNSEYRGTHRLLKRRMWGELKERWSTIARSEKEKNKGWAHYNLALLHEMDGDLNDAIEKVDLALDYIDSSIIVFYLDNLKLRRETFNRQQQ